MIDHLRRCVCAALAPAQEILLATCCQAELQVSRLPGEGRDLALYLLVPRASDHLFNLEREPQVVVVTQAWELRGLARVLAPASRPRGLALCGREEAQWSELVAVQVQRLHLYASGRRPAETIDIEPTTG